jgi:hypothetical protein
MELAGDNHVEDGDEKKRDGEADRDVEERAFYASPRFVYGGFRAAEDSSHTSASDLQEDNDNQRDADDDLGNVEINFHSNVPPDWDEL